MLVAAAARLSHEVKRIFAVRERLAMGHFAIASRASAIAAMLPSMLLAERIPRRHFGITLCASGSHDSAARLGDAHAAIYYLHSRHTAEARTRRRLRLLHADGRCRRLPIAASDAAFGGDADDGEFQQSAVRECDATSASLPPHFAMAPQCFHLFQRQKDGYARRITVAAEESIDVSAGPAGHERASPQLISVSFTSPARFAASRRHRRRQHTPQIRPPLRSRLRLPDYFIRV